MTVEAISPAAEPLLGLPGLLDEVGALAERVRQSVVLVRGSRSGTGSGVVWNDAGLVITNHHCVPGDRAEIALAGRARVGAKVVARAATLDLAALQIEADADATADGRRRTAAMSGLTPATIGDSKELRVGELVVAVGNPLGERNAVTFGMVSGVGAIASPNGEREVIRAAITVRPGNSGGALANVHGQVVGIPHMVVGPGLALAVPSHVVERFLLSERGGQAFFGFGGQWVELPTLVVERYSLPNRLGIMLNSVVAASPAEQAGLTLGDVVVDVLVPTRPDSTRNGRDGGRAGRRDGGAGDWEQRGEAVDLLARLGSTPVGRPARLAVIRGGELHWFEATPGEKC